MIDWDTFSAKVLPTLLSGLMTAVVLLVLGLAGMLAREIVSPTPPWPAPPRCCPTNPQ